MWARWAFLAERMFDCRTFVRPEVPKTTVEPAWAVLRMFQGMALHRTLRTWTFHRAGQLVMVQMLGLAAHGCQPSESDWRQCDR